MRLVGQVDAEPLVEHRDQVAEQVQPRVRPGPDRRDAPLDRRDPLRAVVLGLERDDHVVRGHQRGPRAQVEVRRAVDQDQVEVARGPRPGARGSRAPRRPTPTAGVMLYGGQRLGAGDDRDAGEAGRPDQRLGDRGEVGRRRGPRRSRPGDRPRAPRGPKNPWVRRRLGVGVDQQHAPAGLGERAGQVVAGARSCRPPLSGSTS